MFRSGRVCFCTSSCGAPRGWLLGCALRWAVYGAGSDGCLDSQDWLFGGFASLKHGIRQMWAMSMFCSFVSCALIMGVPVLPAVLLAGRGLFSCLLWYKAANQSVIIVRV